MKFLDYITNIITLSEETNEGDADCILNLQVNGFGVSGNAQGLIFLPEIEETGEGELQSYAHLEIPMIELLSNNAVWADNEFPLIEASGILGEPLTANIQFPILESNGFGRNGNSGEYYFYVQVEGTGNANQEYELCE